MFAPSNKYMFLEPWVTQNKGVQRSLILALCVHGGERSHRKMGIYNTPSVVSCCHQCQAVLYDLVFCSENLYHGHWWYWKPSRLPSKPWRDPVEGKWPIPANCDNFIDKRKPVRVTMWILEVNLSHRSIFHLGRRLESFCSPSTLRVAIVVTIESHLCVRNGAEQKGMQG